MLVLLRDLWFEEIGDREDDIRPTHAQTFEWILDPNSSKADAWNFVDWLCRQNSEFNSDRIFWVSGKAGSGKSTLMKYLYRDPRLKSHLKLWANGLPLICAAVFIWDRGKSMMHKSREGMVRSLLHQILSRHKHLIPLTFHKRWNIDYAIRSTQDVEDWLSHERRGPSWDWSELILALKLLTDESFLEQHDTRMRLCIFVDGMDEYRTFDDPNLPPNEIISRKKQGFRDIAELFKQLAQSSVVKLCLSSRHLVEFLDAFNVRRQRIKLEDLTFTDITVYTGAHLKAMKDGRLCVLKLQILPGH